MAILSRQMLMKKILLNMLLRFGPVFLRAVRTIFYNASCFLLPPVSLNAAFLPAVHTVFIHSACFVLPPVRYYFYLLRPLQDCVTLNEPHAGRSLPSILAYLLFCRGPGIRSAKSPYLESCVFCLRCYTQRH